MSSCEYLWFILISVSFLDAEINIFFFKFGSFCSLFLEILFLLFLYSSRITIIYLLMVAHKSQKLSSKSWLRSCICIWGHIFKSLASTKNPSLVFSFFKYWASKLVRCGSLKHMQRFGHTHSHKHMCGIL